MTDITKHIATSRNALHWRQ